MDPDVEISLRRRRIWGGGRYSDGFHQRLESNERQSCSHTHTNKQAVGRTSHPTDAHCKVLPKPSTPPFTLTMPPTCLLFPKCRLEFMHKRRDGLQIHRSGVACQTTDIYCGNICHSLMKLHPRASKQTDNGLCGSRLFKTEGDRSVRGTTTVLDWQQPIYLQANLAERTYSGLSMHLTLSTGRHLQVFGLQTAWSETHTHTHTHTRARARAPEIKHNRSTNSQAQHNRTKKLRTLHRPVGLYQGEIRYDTRSKPRCLYTVYIYIHNFETTNAATAH